MLQQGNIFYHKDVIFFLVIICNAILLQTFKGSSGHFQEYLKTNLENHIYKNGKEKPKKGKNTQSHNNNRWGMYTATDFSTIPENIMK